MGPRRLHLGCRPMVLLPLHPSRAPRTTDRNRAERGAWRASERVKGLRFGCRRGARRTRPAGRRDCWGVVSSQWTVVSRDFNGSFLTTDSLTPDLLEEEDHLLVEPLPDAVEEGVSEGVVAAADAGADFQPGDELVGGTHRPAGCPSMFSFTYAVTTGSFSSCSFLFGTAWAATPSS